MWGTATVWAGEESGKGLPRSSPEAEQVVWCGEKAGLRSGSYSEQPDREKNVSSGIVATLMGLGSTRSSNP